MHDAGGVRLGEALGGLDGDVEELLRRQRLARGDELAQGLALDELHGDVDGPVGLADVVDRQDVGVVQGRGRAGLLLEALAAVGIGRRGRRQDLDRDLAPELRVLAPGRPHPSRPRRAARGSRRGRGGNRRTSVKCGDCMSPARGIIARAEGTLIGRTLSHYRVEKRLGAGGMGEVFLARDLALGRMAAVKVLASSLSAEARARLVREAAGERPAPASGDRDLLRGGRVGRRRVSGDGVRRGRDAARPSAARAAAVSAGALADGLAARGARARARGRGASPGHQARERHGDGRQPRQAARLRHRRRSGRHARERGRHRGRADRAGQPSSGRSATCRPSSSGVSPSTNAPTCSRSEPCSTRRIEGRPAFPGETAADRIAAILAADVAPLAASGVPPETARRPRPRARARSRAALSLGGRVPVGAARPRLGRARRVSPGHARDRRLPEPVAQSGRRLDRERLRREPGRGPRAPPGRHARPAREGAARPRGGRRRGTGPRARARLPMGALRGLPACGPAPARDRAALGRHDG